MQPFSLNMPPSFTGTLSNSFSKLSHLQNFQIFQRLQIGQNLQFQTSPVLAKSIQNPQILSTIPSKDLSYSSLFSRPPQGPLLECSNTIDFLQSVGANHDMNNQITSLMLAWKVQNNIQSELYKSQLAQLIEMQRQLDQKMKENQNLLNKSGLPQEQTSYINKLEPVAVSQMKKTLKNKIRAMIQFVLQNSGRISDSQIEAEKDKYKDNSNLVGVFDDLISKYVSTIKTKEEMIKYTVRKAFKFIKNQVKKENRVDSKEASAYLCQRYFKDYTGTIPDLDNEEDFLKFVLPFRKNSKNKTMNSSFIHEVFASHEFRMDYQGFLDDLDEILEIDNNAKLERFVNFIEENLKKNKIPDIKKYKRIPWPQVWIVNTKKIAADLPDSGSHETFEETKRLTSRNSEIIPNSSQNLDISESITRGAESSPSTH